MHVFFCVSKNVSVSCAYTQGKREQFSGFNRTLDAINNVFRKFSAFHDETGRLNVDGMNIISNDGSNKLNRSRKARVSYKVQRTINASLNAATSTRAVSSNPNFVTRQKIEIILDRKSGSAGMPRPISYAVFCLKKKTPNGAGHSQHPSRTYSTFHHRRSTAPLKDHLGRAVSPQCPGRG